ncbi:glycosyltransferase family 2 protein [Chryseobacterium sp. BIGb0232]|uniref:glycosyltransferase family 2 protein n=1 Tax=Chryseobacterium sp. BIGb0232 TaxID=2940598 RepID=UPI000F4740EE|nr:glycosyltransferase [Chryseobacterium sp. BIGb0232]MCS4301639.1 GT2 family glycosyltransferase [Chryseobacterium sp. BIGb0232]ROS19507.1 GT2 family glycosyltransferase [Chryseobacterium nakagawai]
MFISVIIPTYNRVDTLNKCLQHLENQSIGIENYEVIIVDDCSIDNTPEFCENYVLKSENVRYIRNEKNSGQATTRNVGIRASKGDIVLFLDNDLLVSDTFLEAHLNLYKAKQDENIAVVSDVTYQAEDLDKTNFGRFIQSRAIGYRSEKYMRGIDFSDIPSNFFAGGGSSCKKEDAFKIGLFEEGLKKYGSEDELFGYRLKKAGFKIVFCPDAKLIHYDNNISPHYWKIKFVELGRYSLRTLKEKEPELIDNSLYDLLMPIDAKKENLKKTLFKLGIKFFSSALFRIPVEKYVFTTDENKNFYSDIIYRYMTMLWIIEGFNSDKQIEKVKY